MPAADSLERLHFLLIRHVIETGHAPTLQKLAEMANLLEQKAAGVLKELERNHGVILVPNSLQVWSIHPFALNPTTFWVSSASGAWWANCAWCSLGIWAALKRDVTISTANGGEGGSLEFSISGKSSRPDLLVHFPYPPDKWWENPFAPCANILFFSSEQQIDSWCLRHGHPRGSVLPIDVALRLADLWFGDYASPEWVRKTSRQAMQIFEELKLEKPFWKLSPTFR